MLRRSKTKELPNVRLRMLLRLLKWELYEHVRTKSSIMNIVFLYGNGFDRALGLETSYDSFLTWAVDKDVRRKHFTPSAYEFLGLIQAHKGDGKWSNFESALGLCQYDKMVSCKGFQSLDYAMNTVNAGQELLRAFLKEKSAKFNKLAIPNNARGVFVEGFYRLCRENGFAFDPSIDDIQFASLNYTDTLEVILCQHTVFHPHGELKHGSLIFGVDNKRQLKNLNCGEFARLLCKHGQIEENAIGCNNNRDERLARMIGSAGVLILFGLSFGPSDYRIWNTIGRCSVVRGTKIVICPFHGDEVANFKRGIYQWGLFDNEVDENWMSISQKVSANIVEATDSRNDFFGLKAIKNIRANA